MRHILKTLLFFFSFLTYPLYADSEIEVKVHDASTIFEYNNSLDFEITLSKAPGKEFLGIFFGDKVDIYYSTYNLSALEKSDYVPQKQQKITFQGRETSKIIHIDVINDEIHEEQEKMFIKISFNKHKDEDEKKLRKKYKIEENKAFGIIENDDKVTKELEIGISNQSIEETNQTSILKFYVTLNQKAPSAGVTIDFYSIDDSAVNGIDYNEVNSSLFIAKGKTEGEISVSILGNTEFEPTKRFYLKLSKTSQGTIVNNQAIGTITDDDPEHPFADLSIKITDSSDPISSNEDLTYTIQAINNGEEKPSEVKLKIELPKGSIFQKIKSNGWECELKGSKIDCSYDKDLHIENFPAYYPDIILTITTPPENNDIVLKTTIKSKIRDPKKENNKVSEVTHVFSKKTDMSISITSTPNPASISSSLTYNINITNNSNILANNVKFTNTLPENVTFVSIDSENNNWSCSQGETIICDYIGNEGNYLPNQTTNIALKVNTPPSEGSISNTVIVETSTIDFNLNNNLATNITEIQENNDIEGIVPFFKLLQYNINGDITLIGNANIGSTQNLSYNDSANMQFIDTDNEAATINSSSSTLDLNDDYKIKWAGLYWEGTTETKQSTIGNLLFSTPSSNGYINIKASKLYEITDNGFFKYSAFLDVTSLVQTSGTYGIANMTLSTGIRGGGGHFGGWTILIIYEDPSERISYKNISVFNGYNYVNQDNFDFSLDGFVTPLSGPINASVAFFAGDGDPAIGGVARMKVGKTNNFNYVGGDNSNPKNNLLNGSIAKFGIPLNPNVTQTFGVDADIIDVSSFMVNNQKNTAFKFDIRTPSGGVDWYTLSMFAFATSLTVPDISSFKKEGVIVHKSGTTTPINSSSTIYEGSEILYTLSFKNTGTEIAKDVEIFDNFEFNKLLDIFNLDTFDGSKIKLSFKNSQNWDNNASCGYDSNKKKVWCKLNEVDIGDEYKMQFSVRLYEKLPEHIGESINNKAYINYKNATTGNYIIRVNNEDGAFGGESNNLNGGIISEKKTVGVFNIQRTNSINNDLDFALYTQIQGRDFNYDVVFYDINLTKEQDVEGIPLKIELIDQEDNRTLYTSYQYYPFATKNKTKDSRIHILSSKDLNDINATRDAIFKITYIIKDKENILQHTCKEKQTYKNCYDEHFSKNPKTQTVFSQDNFSIRPESYHLKISDNIRELRDSDIKINYPLALAAGYGYNVSINAYSYESNSSAKGYSSKAIQTLIFKDKSTCLDQRSPHKEINFINGQYHDINFRHENVGRYSLTVEDNNWTQVDSIKGDCLINHSDSSFREYEKSGCQIKPPVNDINLKFYPYQFDVNFTINNLPNSQHQNFIYMSNINGADHYMSIQLLGSIIAKSENNITTTNFTSNCVAEEVDLWLEADITSDNGLNQAIQTTPNINNIRGDVFFNRLRSIDSLLFQTNRHIPDIRTPISITRDNFLDNNITTAGQVRNIDLRYNIDKNITQPINPILVNFQNIHVNSKKSKSNTENQKDYIPTGMKNISALKYFYFTRVKPFSKKYPRVIYSGQAVDVNTPFSIEIFCKFSNTYCNNMQVFNNTSDYASINKQSGWYISTNHHQNLDGNITRLNPLSNGLTIQPNINQSFRNSKNSVVVSTIVNGNNKINNVEVIVPPQLQYDPDIANNGNPQYAIPQTSTSPSEWTGIGQVGHIIETEVNTKNSGKSSW